MNFLLYLLPLAAFLLGAIPFGFIAGRLRGVDLREQGSKNIGATNTMRVLGKGPGALVLFLDAMKGCAPVLLSHYLRLGEGWEVALGLCAVLGHIYSPFVRFKGGKGVATSLGVLIGLAPPVAGGVVLVFAVTVWLTRFVSLGSLCAALATGALFFILPGYGMPCRVFGLVAAFFVIFRHRANIQRLRSGTEARIGDKKPDSSAGTAKK